MTISAILIFQDMPHVIWHDCLIFFVFSFILFSKKKFLVKRNQGSQKKTTFLQTSIIIKFGKNIMFVSIDTKRKFLSPNVKKG